MNSNNLQPMISVGHKALSLTDFSDILHHKKRVTLDKAAVDKVERMSNRPAGFGIVDFEGDILGES